MDNSFLSIKEFSDLSGIEATTLRYWDEIGLFQPAKRDPLNGYRFYTPDQIIAVNFITVLSSLNAPLKTIGAISQTRSPADIIQLIERQERELDAEIHRIHESYTVIHTRRDLIKIGLDLATSTKQIFTRQLNEHNFVPGERTIFKPGQSFYGPFIQFCKQAKDQHINLRLPIGGLHKSWDDFTTNPEQPQHYISIDPAGNRSRPSGEYLVGFTRGYYGQLGDLPQRMTTYIAKNHLTVTGQVVTIYLHDEVCLKTPSEYLAAISVAVQAKP